MIKELAEKMSGELLVFDSDYIRTHYYSLSSYSLLRTSLCNDFRKIYFTRDPHKLCTCDILVVEISQADEIIRAQLRDEYWCVIYTQNPFKTLVKYLNQCVKHKSLVIDICGAYIVINMEKEYYKIWNYCKEGLQKYIEESAAQSGCEITEHGYVIYNEGIESENIRNTKLIKGNESKGRYKLSGNIKPIWEEKQIGKGNYYKSQVRRASLRGNNLRKRGLRDKSERQCKRRECAANFIIEMKESDDESSGVGAEPVRCFSSVEAKRPYFLSPSSSCPE